MVFQYINRPHGGAARAYDADVLAWESAAVANGGTPDLDYRRYLDDFVYAAKTSGAWALTDDYWVFWAPDAACALTSLKQRRLATAVNAPTFTANRGYAFDGTTQYIDTGFVPSTHAVAMTGTSLALDVYERTNVGILRYHGAYSNGTRSLYLGPRTAGNVYTGGANGEVGNVGSVSDSRGLTGIERSAGTVGVDKNGVSVATTTPSVGSTLPSLAIYLGAYNNAGTPASFRGVSLGFAVARAALSAPQKLAQYNAIQTFATAVGAQV